jgi:predicted nucleic acid-binding protein
MIVADTGAVVALIDGDDHHHDVFRKAFEKNPREWVLPWAILPEVDYLVASRLGPSVARAFRKDLAQGLFLVEWGKGADLARALELDDSYGDLRLGLVDGVVMAVAERLEARAIATTDLRDFAPVELAGGPQLWPRDL